MSTKNPLYLQVSSAASVNELTSLQRASLRAQTSAKK